MILITLKSILISRFKIVLFLPLNMTIKNIKNCKCIIEINQNNK